MAISANDVMPIASTISTRLKVDGGENDRLGEVISWAGLSHICMAIPGIKIESSALRCVILRYGVQSRCNSSRSLCSPPPPANTVPTQSEVALKRALPDQLSAGR